MLTATCIDWHQKQQKS